MTAKLLFTHHAVSRYVQRHARDLSIPEARRVLEEAAHDAVKLGCRSIKNDADQWELPSLGIRLLVKPDERQGAEEEPQQVVLTVLPQRRPQQDDVELIAYLRAEAQTVFARVKAERDDNVVAIAEAHRAQPKLSIEALESRQRDLNENVKIAKLELAAIESWAQVLTAEQKTLRTQITHDT